MLKEALRLDHFENKVEYTSMLYALAQVIQKENNAQDAKSILLKELVEYTNIYFAHQDTLKVFFEIIEGRSEDIGLSGVCQQLLFINLNCYQHRWDEQTFNIFKAWIKETAHEPFDKVLSHKSYQQLKPVLSTEQLLLVMQKDIKAHLKHHESFHKELENIYYFQSKSLIFDKMLSQRWSMLWLWLKSIFSSQTRNPYELKSLFNRAQVNVEKNFFYSLIDFVQTKPELLGGLLKDPKINKVFEKIEDFDQKFLMYFDLNYNNLDNFESVLKLHQSLLGDKFNEETLTANIEKHIALKGEAVEKIYRLYYQSTFINKESNVFNRSLDNVFSSQNESNERIYQTLSQRELSLTDTLDLQEFCHWLNREHKVIDEQIFNNLWQVSMGSYDAGQFTSSLWQNNLQENLSFKLNKNNHLEIFEQVDPLVLRKIYLSSPGVFDQELSQCLQIYLLRHNAMTLEEFLPTYKNAVLLQNKNLAKYAYSLYDQLTDIQEYMGFTYVCQQLMPLLDKEELTPEQRLLANLPFDNLTFNTQRVQRFLTWYNASSQSAQIKARYLVENNFKNLFQRPVLMNTIDASVIKQLLHLIGSQRESDNVEHWYYANEIIVDIASLDNDRDILDYMARIDFSVLSQMDITIRSCLVDAFNKKSKSDSHNLYSTIAHWIEDIDSPDIQKLLLSPRQFALDFIQVASTQSKVEINPITADYLRECLIEEDKDIIYNQVSKVQDPSKELLSFVQCVSERKVKSKQLKADEALSQVPDAHAKEIMQKLVSIESYLMKRTHYHLKHPVLIQDLSHQAFHAVKSSYYDQIVVESLEKQITEHPVKNNPDYKKDYKLAQNIFYAAWACQLRDDLANGEMSSFDASCKALVAQKDNIESKTAKGMIGELEVLLAQRRGPQIRKVN